MWPAADSFCSCSTGGRDANGIVTAMTTAIVVAVTRVNCVEVIHTKALLCYDDTLMRHWDSACTEIGGQLKRWYWPWSRKMLFNCRPKCQSLCSISDQNG